MDWARHDHRAAPRVEPPAPILIETRWRAVGPSEVSITCGIYKALRYRVEVRCFYDDGGLIRTQLAESMDAAREHADAWLQALREKGSFTELPIADGPIQAIREKGGS
jgi:hypothetical protein